MQKEELKDAVRYEQLLQKEAVAPTKFEEAILTEDLAKSAGRINIARIARNTNLQSAILDQLLKDDNLDAFNKNIDAFMKLLKNKKFTSLEQFKKDFAYFLDNQLLLPTEPIIIESSAPPLEAESEAKLRVLDAEFIDAIQKDTGKSIDEVDEIKLFTPKTNKRSNTITKLNKTGKFITFKPQKGSSIIDDKKNYIIQIAKNPVMPALAVPTIKRSKPSTPPESTVGASSEAVSSGATSSGATSSGATSSGSGLFPLKKKSTHIRYR